MPARLSPANPDNTGRGRVALPIMLATIFCAIVFFEAHYKLLWGDEFVTYWIGQQRSFHGIWNALAAGADPNPPLMHVLNWGSTSLFGSTPVAIRLPSILGVALAFVSLWAIICRYAAPVYAASGCLLLMTMRGFDYAYDARSYGLLLGFATAALAAWIFANESTGRPRRIFWLFAMALALACALSSNYYGVLAFFPIAAGELTLLRRTRTFKVGPWLAMLVASLPLLAYRGLIRANIAEFGPHAWNKPQLSMLAESYFVLVEGIFWPILVLAIILLWRRKRNKPLRPSQLPAEVTVALWVALAYPILGYVIAFLGAGMISARCVIPVCAAFALAGAILLPRLASRRAATLVLCGLIFWVGAREAACAYLIRQQRHAFLRLRDHIERTAAPGETVVVSDSLTLMPLYWYSSPGLRSQIVFPIDFDLIHRFASEDSGEQNLWAGRHGVFPAAIDKPAALIPPAAESILVADPNGWLAKTLQSEGFTLQQDPANVAWEQLGGVFTGLAHDETRVFFAVPPTASTPAAEVSSKP